MKAAKQKIQKKLELVDHLVFDFSHTKRRLTRDEPHEYLENESNLPL